MQVCIQIFKNQAKLCLMYLTFVINLLCVYLESKNLNHYKHCENINRPWKLNEKLCRVYDLLGNKDLSYWGSCTSKQQFGFPAGSPCILLQLNRVSKLNAKVAY